MYSEITSTSPYSCNFVPVGEKIESFDLFKPLMLALQHDYQCVFDEEQLTNTPVRLSNMYSELLCGYRQDPEKILSKTFIGTDDMVIMKEVPFVSLCAHHWLPFMGHCSIGYIPQNKKIVGLSKLPRVINCFARRFQIQEQMTSQIADAIYNNLCPSGCIVITQARHLCAEIRGVQTKNSDTIVSAVRGCFENKEQRDEFLKLIK